MADKDDADALELEDAAYRARQFLWRATLQFMTAEGKYLGENQTMKALMLALLSVAAVVTQSMGEAEEGERPTKVIFLELASISFDEEQREAALPEDETENKTA